jgi:hypothetical protein
MNKIMMASLAILVLAIGIGSQALVHSAEAKGMPKYWLNGDGAVKSKYLGALHGVMPASHKYTKPSESHHK